MNILRLELELWDLWDLRGLLDLWHQRHAHTTATTNARKLDPPIRLPAPVSRHRLDPHRKPLLAHAVRVADHCIPAVCQSRLACG